MDKQQAKAAMERMHPDLGDWIYGASPLKAEQRANDYLSDAQELEGQDDDPIIKARALRLVAKATLLTHLAACLRVVGCDMPAPPMEELPEGVARFRPKQAPDNIIFHNSDETSMEVDFEDMETFDLETVKKAPPPKFEMGQEVWLVTQPEDGEDQVGFVECVIVGIDHAVEDTHYLIGFLDDDGVTVRTSYECICAHELVADPDHYDDSRPKRLTRDQVRASMRVVK